MILPTKHLLTERSLIGIGGEILSLLSESKTVSRLWDDFRQARIDSNRRIVGFDRFVLALDLLYLMQVIDLERERLFRRGSP